MKHWFTVLKVLDDVFLVQYNKKKQCWLLADMHQYSQMDCLKPLLPFDWLISVKYVANISEHHAWIKDKQ